MPNQATATDLPLYDIFVPQKVRLLKISDDVIACDFRFGPPIKNFGYAYAWGRGEFRAVCPPKSLCAPQMRVNFCNSTRGPANFCPKTGHHKRFFSMKQQERSRERDQAARDFAIKTFFLFLFFGLHLQL